MIRTLDQPTEELVWPPGAERDRIRFLMNIRTANDLFVRERFLGMIDFLAGAENINFFTPYDVYMTPGERLYVTDTGKGCLHIINLQDHRYDEVRSLGRDAALAQPIGVTADGEGNVYVSDSMLANVFVFSSQGEFLRALAPEGFFQRPADLMFCAGTGALYVADVTAHEVKVVRPDGSLVRTIGGRGAEAGRLNYPSHLWVEPDGTLFVVGVMDTAINVFGPAGEFLMAFGRHGDTSGYVSRPKGVATDSDGHIYVVDAIFDNYQIFNRRGQLLLTVGESGSAPGEFSLPAGIFIDSKDRVFVADQQNRRVSVFEYLQGGME